MPIDSQPIPELRLWNNGEGIAPADWIWIEGRADHALAFSALFWPEILVFEDYVLRAPLDISRLRSWEDAGHSPAQVETAMNVLFLEGIFPNDPSVEDLKETQLIGLAGVMAEMVSAKLARNFPDRSFSTFVIDEGSDFGVSFHQTR